MINTPEKLDECILCNEESTKLYQCCPKQADRICEQCWDKLISIVITKGKISSLLKKQLPCEFCHEPIEHNRLPEEIKTRINEIYLTIPKTKTPKSIEEFNYSYKNSNELRNCLTDEKFIFLTQRHYNLLGGCIDTYIQSLMRSDQWNYEELWLPLKEEPTDDHHDQVNIFISKDFNSNENGCLVLLQGSGVVVQDNGMFPYMTKAKENNLSVIILNPNQTSYIEKKLTDTNDTSSDNKKENQTSADTTTDSNKSDNTISTDDDIISFYLSSSPLPTPVMKKIPNLSTNREHVLYVYDHILAKCPAKKFYIVAHSAGGDGLMYLLRKRQDDILSRLAKIAFTDSVHSVLSLDSNEIKSFLKSNAIHFIANDEPMGTPIDYVYDFSQGAACPEVSAGHPKHEYTSGHAVHGVFDFFFPRDQINDNDNDIDRTKF